MNGYVAQRRGRFYAVIYEGRDPVTGKEIRRWHPAGTDRAEAERLAAKLAATETKRTDAIRSLTFGAYLTSQWLLGYSRWPTTCAPSSSSTRSPWPSPPAAATRPWPA